MKTRHSNQTSNVLFYVRLQQGDNSVPPPPPHAQEKEERTEEIKIIYINRLY